jgi:hypothetical protein
VQVRELYPPEAKTKEGKVDITVEPTVPTEGSPAAEPAQEQQLPPPTEGPPAAETTTQAQASSLPKYHIQVGLVRSLH